MKRILAGIGIAVLLVIGVWGGTSLVAAQGSGPVEGIPVTLHGWVQALQGDVLVLEGYGATVDVLLTDNTLIGGKVGEEGRALLETGKAVWVRGRLADDGSITAYMIRPVPKQHAPRQRIQGVVVAKDAGSLIVETPLWEVVVTVDENTRIIVPGVEQPSLNDIAIGQRIMALGRWEDRTFYARVLALAPRHGKPVVVSGAVSDVGDSSLVLETDNGSVTVLVSDRTRIRLQGVPNATLADVEVGMELHALGKWQEGQEGQVLEARVLTDRLPRFGRGGRPGHTPRPGPRMGEHPVDTPPFAPAP